MTGTYTSPKRVERDGRLIAFEGEVMTMAEAASRGLVEEEKPKGRRASKPKADKAGEADSASEADEAGKSEEAEAGEA